MVITMLEATIPEDYWPSLQRTYDAGVERLPSQITETFLLHDTADRTVWRIVTVWRSREALDEYRRSVDVPGGVAMFRSVGVEPTLRIFDVASHAEATITKAA